MMWLTGDEDSAPLRIGIPICDLLAGYFAAMGILVALLERETSGRGQEVQTSLLEAFLMASGGVNELVVSMYRPKMAWFVVS